MRSLQDVDIACNSMCLHFGEDPMNRESAEKAAREIQKFVPHEDSKNRWAGWGLCVCYQCEKVLADIIERACGQGYVDPDGLTHQEVREAWKADMVQCGQEQKELRDRIAELERSCGETVPCELCGAVDHHMKECPPSPPTGRTEEK